MTPMKLQVNLLNARHTKTLPGRKIDVLEGGDSHRISSGFAPACAVREFQADEVFPLRWIAISDHASSRQVELGAAAGYQSMQREPFRQYHLQSVHRDIPDLSDGCQFAPVAVFPHDVDVSLHSIADLTAGIDLPNRGMQGLLRPQRGLRVS